MVYSMADLIHAWQACGGSCAVSGLPFSLEVVGNGQTKRPFAPSLDRIDRHKPYQRDNVQLVLSIANFAMNAWGAGPLITLSDGVYRRHGKQPAKGRAPSDGDLDNVATIDVELVETDLGTLSFPPRPDLYKAILEMLEAGCKSSRKIEDTIAKRFHITATARKAVLKNNCPAWRNHVAWALVDLGTHKGGRGGMGKIERLRGEPAGDGGSMGIYCLTEKGRADLQSPP